MQPHQTPSGQPMQQNYSMQQGPQMQNNFSNQPNYQMQQNFQMNSNLQMQENPQNQQNFQMNSNPQIQGNPQNQQNFQMNSNPPMQENPQNQQNFQMNSNPQIQANPQNQQNFQMNSNPQMQFNSPNHENPQMQQNFQMQNQQVQPNPQNQYNPPKQQNYQMPPNPQMQNQQMPPNPQMQNQQMPPNPQMQNQQMPPNPQMQNQQMPSNPQMQQPNNAPLTGSQSRPLPPPLPRNSSQNLYPSMQRASSQRIPLRSTSSMNNSMSLQQGSNFSSTASMQSVGSSDSEEPSRPLSRQNSSQTFPVIYNNITYKVNPDLLCNASPKIKEMLLPYINENRLNEAHLEILGHNFSYRNINNFLKLCQNLPTDVENSEMKEICEIAKLCGAEKIYNTGVTFIRQNMDPNFSVPDNKYDGSDGKKYMFVDDERHSIDHSGEIQSNMAQNNEEEEDEDDEADNNDDVKQNPSSKKDSPIDTTKISSVIYSVKVEKHALRCPVFHFYDDKNVLFTAKQKNENIYIGEGYDVHISSNQKNHVAHISQDDCLHNIIFLKDKNFKLKYVDSGKPNHLSINVTFPLNQDKNITWTPKPPKYDPIRDKYYLNFHGEHHHTPMKSKKNIVLQNENGHPTFIVRKMDYDMYEIECLPLVDPLIAFVIGLSDIVGPYMDPWGEITF